MNLLRSALTQIAPLAILAALASSSALAFSGKQTHDPAPVLSPLPRVLLITSMAIPADLPIIQVDYFKTAKYRMERTFRKMLAGIEYPLEVIHNPDISTLKQALEAPNNLAVFWVSHAGNFGLFGGDVLTDVQGRNVKGAFAWVNPNTHFLALAGCTTNPILTHMKNDDHFFDDNLGIETWGTDDKVEARAALTDAINKFLVSLPQIQSSFHGQAVCPTKKVYPVTVTREADLTLPPGTMRPSVRVEVAGKLLGVIDRKSTRLNSSH